MARVMREQQPASAGQREQVRQYFAEEVLDALSHVIGDLSYAQAARLIAAQHGQLADLLEDSVYDAVHHIGDPSRYADQEVRGMEVRGYASGYVQARPVEEQMDLLNRDREKWGVREFVLTEEQKVLLQQMDPSHLEGIFLLPPYNMIGVSTYLAAVEKMLNNFWGISTLPYALRGLQETASKVHRLRHEWQRQGSGNLTLVWAQLGALYAGKSSLRAKELMLRPEEGGLGVYGFLSMLTTHPERLKQSIDPAVLCCGDEVPIAGGSPRDSRVPAVTFFGNTLRFDTVRWDDCSPELMPASMLIPHKVD